MCSNLPFSRVYSIIPNIFYIISYYLILLCFVHIKNISKLRKNKLKRKIINSKQKVIASIIAIVLIASCIKIIPQDLKIYFIDVGQRRCFTNNNTKR